MQRLNGITRRAALERLGVLLGGALAAPTVSGVLGGCRAEPDAAWSPAALSSDQADLVAAVVDRIIPPGTTPGAREAGVPQFIDKMLAEWYPEDLRRSVLDGLSDLDSRARVAGDEPFVSLSAERQDAILADIDQAGFAPSDAPIIEGPVPNLEAGGYDVLSPALRERAARVAALARERTTARRPDGGPIVRADVDHEGVRLDDQSFWKLMKELTLVGYYTSEVGATEELTYVRVPGRWEGCIDFSEIGRAWA